jgi:hypothetical protein
MGLDMYLNKKRFLWTEERKKLKIIGITDIQSNKVTEIVMKAGYWRKANAIHKWFVDNVQDGEDDCKEYYVSKEQMLKLLDTVNKVLKDSKLVKGKVYNGTSWTREKGEIETWVDGKIIKDPSTAKKLLPVMAGFFFGNSNENTAYNEYYINDLKETKKILKEALKDKACDYYYQSSW